MASKDSISDAWNEYRHLCDQPNVLSRWMLEQTIQLINDPALTQPLASVIVGTPLGKPADQYQNSLTDMFVVSMTKHQLEPIVVEVRRAVAENRTLPTGRGLGGFEESWSEYLEWLNA